MIIDYWIEFNNIQVSRVLVRGFRRFYWNLDCDELLSESLHFSLFQLRQQKGFTHH